MFKFNDDDDESYSTSRSLTELILFALSQALDTAAPCIALRHKREHVASLLS
jgi:hypothetical protein